IPTLAKTCENFSVGEVYNIGGQEFRSVEELSDIVLNYVGKSDELVEYLSEDKHNVVNKRANIEKARKAFGYDPKIPLEVGVPKTLEWMKSVYK
ncbi:unnamed protein product, partial [marine sediment metagenome]